MKTTLAFLVLSVFLCSLMGCSGETAGDNMAPDKAVKAGSAEDPAKQGKAGGNNASPELPPPAIGGK